MGAFDYDAGVSGAGTTPLLEIPEPPPVVRNIPVDPNEVAAWGRSDLARYYGVSEETLAAKAMDLMPDTNDPAVLRRLTQLYLVDLPPDTIISTLPRGRLSDNQLRTVMGAFPNTPATVEAFLTLLVPGEAARHARLVTHEPTSLTSTSDAFAQKVFSLSSEHSLECGVVAVPLVVLDPNKGLTYLALLKSTGEQSPAVYMTMDFDVLGTDRKVAAQQVASTALGQHFDFESGSLLMPKQP